MNRAWHEMPHTSSYMIPWMQHSGKSKCPGQKPYQEASILVLRGAKGLTAKGWHNGIFTGGRNVPHRDCCHGNYAIVHTCPQSSTCEGAILLYANYASIGQTEAAYRSNTIPFLKKIKTR